MLRSRVICGSAPAVAVALLLRAAGAWALSAPIDRLAFHGIEAIVAFHPGSGAGFGQEQLPGVILGPPRGGGPTQGSLDVLALGNGGEIVVAFGEVAICDGPGVDFTVFENAFHSGSPDGPVFAEVGIVAVRAEDGPFVAFDYDPSSFAGLAGVTPVLSHPDNGVLANDPAVSGGDGFDLAEVGIARARWVRITDPGDAIADPGNRLPPGTSGGFDLDAIAVIHPCAAATPDATPTPTATATVTATALAGAGEGDIDADGQVDHADLARLVEEIFDGDGDRVEDVPGGAVVSTAAADANRDGRVTAVDLSAWWARGEHARQAASRSPRSAHPNASRTADRRRGATRRRCQRGAGLATTSEDVVVSAPAESRAQQEAPTAFVTSIDAQQHADQFETVSDALAESVGVQVRRFGGLGAFSTVSIRGSSSNQVQIYFDGIPMSRARNETVNLADLPLDSLERIDVYRGTVPLAFGVGGLGGVVNLVPKLPGAVPASEFSASYGSFDTRKLVASHTRQIGGVGVLAHLTYLGTDGDFEFFQGADVEDDGGAHQKRENSAFDSVTGLFKVQREIAPRTTIDLTSELFFKDQGIPGTGARQTEDTALSELRTTNFLRFQRRADTATPIDASATVFGSFLNERFEDPQRELSSERSDRDDVTGFFGGNLAGTWYGPFDNEVSWFGEASYEQFDGRNRARRPQNRDDPRQSRQRFALGLQDQLRLLSERVTVVPVMRFERVEDQGVAFDRAGLPRDEFQHGESLWNPGVGAQVRIVDGIDLRANFARLQRAASLSERFGNRGAIQGNPELKPEEGWLRDVGVRLRSPEGWPICLTADYAYFDNDIDDLIIVLSVPGPHPLRPVNVGKARVRGHELAVATAYRWIELDVNYTRQDAENRDAGNSGAQLPGRPRDELYARLIARSEGWQPYYEINFVGENYLTLENYDRNRVGSRLIHTAGLRLQALVWLQLGVEGRNLGNDRAEDAYNYPLPGRSFFGTVKMNL